MVFFALTRHGYEELVSQTGRAPSPIWVNAGVLSEAELAQLRSAGVEVTNFTHTIDAADSEAILVAVQSIQEHHNGQRVWVEYAHDL